MKKLLPLLLFSLLFSCQKTPESAAKEVCNCYQSLGNTEVKNLLDETKKCIDLAKTLRADFSKEELKAFRKATANCVTGGLLEE